MGYQEETEAKARYISKDWLLAIALTFIGTVVSAGGIWTVSTLSAMTIQNGRIEEKIMSLEKRINDPYTRSDAERDFRFRDLRLDAHDARLDRLDRMRN